MFTNQNKKQRNIYFMNLALNQAKINLGNTKKNPSVGCVITKNNSVISAGYTSLMGRPHAEYNAIKNCKDKVLNSEIYITLEPCSHYGKTPPCLNKIIKSKIKKVYFAVNDPDKRSFNKSIKKLKKSNISASKGILSNKIKNFYKSYFIQKEKKLPFVTCKIAISKDFYTINKKEKWITNKYSRGRVHLMRSKHDAIITSSKTIRTDNPLLTCRIKGLEKLSPARIILDNNLKISIKSRVIKDSHNNKTIIFYNKENKKKIKTFNNLNIKTYKIKLNINGDLNLNDALLKVKKLGYSRIFLESGAKLTKSFLESNLVNDLEVFVSNKKLEKFGDGSVKKLFNTYLKNKIYTLANVNLFNEKLISYRIK